VKLVVIKAGTREAVWEAYMHTVIQERVELRETERKEGREGGRYDCIDNNLVSWDTWSRLLLAPTSLHVYADYTVLSMPCGDQGTLG